MPRDRTPLGLALRVLAAALVAVVAIVVRDLVDDPSSPSATEGSRVVDFEVESRLLGERMPVQVVVPPGARDGRRSLLVFLHGRGEDETSYLVEPMFEALREQGGEAPVVAFPRGGPDSYWHDREDGDWGSYVVDEVVPQVADRFEIEPERIGIGGISMGGFGALDLARLNPALFCAVGAHSPAMWQNAGDTAPGAFDDEADFDRHDVLDSVGPPGSPPVLADKRVWLDVGDRDPFRETTEQMLARLEAGDAMARLYVGEGEHESAYWDGNWKRYMQFYARALKKCQADGPRQQAEDREAPAGDGKRKPSPQASRRAPEPGA